MSAGLPDHLDPWRAVKAGLAFAGQVRLQQMPRLAASVVDFGPDLEPQIRYLLRFEQDREGHAVVVGQVSARLHLPCQRCLTEVVVEIDAPLRLGLVRTDQAAERLPEDLDPLVVGDELLNPLDLIEDELLLGIPAVPRHAPGLCQPPWPAGLEGHPDASPGEGDDSGMSAGLDASRDEPHPFAVLAAIKRELGG